MIPSVSISINPIKLVRRGYSIWSIPVLGGMLLLSVAYQGLAQSQPASVAATPSGDVQRGSSETFTGTVWIKPLVLAGDPTDCVVSEVTFEPGARTFWHTHAAGQLLVGMQGTGYYQEKGKSVRILRAGEAVTVAPNVPHWHGASPTSLFTHMAILPNASKTGGRWLQAVTQEEYKANP